MNLVTKAELYILAFKVISLYELYRDGCECIRNENEGIRNGFECVRDGCECI